jgi:predicted permease
VSPVTSLRFAGAAGDARSGRRFRKALIVAQVAVSMLLVWVASLFAGHLSSLRNRELGFDRASILLVTLDWGRAREQRTQWLGLYQDLTARLEAIPGIRSATLSGTTPISGAAGSRFASVPGFTEPPEARRRLAMNVVAPKYFGTFGTPILAGRDFQLEDQGRPRVAIVNAAMARYYFGTGTAVGRQVLFEGDTVPYEIVGVVGDAKYLDLREPPPRTVYLNAVQDRRNVFSQLSVRTAGAPASAAAEVRRVVSDVLSSVPISSMTTMDAQMDASIVPERLLALVAGLFGVLGALLAALGLYGLMAYTVARRTSELGVRIALGATRVEIGRIVFTNALWLVLSGAAIAVPLTFWSQRAAASVVVNLSASGPSSFAIAAGVMVGVGLIAAYVPARRAMKVDPLQALRAE